MESAPGWYGKLPALGDFARRRLPDSFVERWDAWLQQCLQASRATLGEGWLQQYLGAPVWRFLLLPGAMGSAGWAGVLLPSVDRVGRYFPLTVCARLPESTPLGSSLAELEQWLAELAACALLGLDADCGPLRLEAALPGLTPPALPAEAMGPEVLPGLRPVHAGAARQTGLLDGLAARLLPRSLDGESVWWCCDPDQGCTGFHCRGLPAPQAFAGMLRAMPALDRSQPA